MPQPGPTLPAASTNSRPSRPHRPTECRLRRAGNISRAFTLRRKGLRYSEIALKLGVSEACAYRWVQRALAGLGDPDLGAAHAHAVARCAVLLDRLALLGDRAPASYTDSILRVQAALRAQLASGNAQSAGEGACRP